MKPKVHIGIILFILVLVLFVLVAAPMQQAWKMWGLALTEVLLLVCAVLPALLLKWDLTEVFPVKKPSFRQIFGVVILWAGGYLAVLAVNLIIAYFFPKGMQDVSTTLLELFKSVPFPVTLFIVAVMPAVCEEALHRGFILYTFKDVNKWTTIISMGIIFGIFHLDIYRFLGTGILGILLSYIMVETNNILLPMLFHFLNNFVSTFSALTAQADVEMNGIPLITVGVFLLLTAAVPFLFIGGSKLLKTKEESKRRPVSKRAKWLAFGSALILAVVGLGTSAAYVFNPPVLITSFTQDVNSETEPLKIEFAVEKGGSYLFTYKIEGNGIAVEMIITNSHGEEFHRSSGMSYTGNGFIDLPADQYTVTFKYNTEGTDYITVNVDVLIK